MTTLTPGERLNAEITAIEEELAQYAIWVAELHSRLEQKKRRQITLAEVKSDPVLQQDLLTELGIAP